MFCGGGGERHMGVRRGSFVNSVNEKVACWMGIWMFCGGGGKSQFA